MGKEQTTRVSAGMLAALANKKRKQLSIPRSHGQLEVKQDQLASLPKRKRSQLSTSRSEVHQVQRESLTSLQSTPHTAESVRKETQQTLTNGQSKDQEQERRRSTYSQAAQGQVPQTLLQSIPHTTEAVRRETLQTLPTTEETNGRSEDQGPTGKKTRGSTQMQEVHGRSERMLIFLNGDNQPVGPTKAIVSELSSFLGTLARNSALCPISILDWRKVPQKTKDDLWAYTLEKYNIPVLGKKWVLKTIKDARRRYKLDLKRDFYLPGASLEVQMKNRPYLVPQSEFKNLIEYWNSEKSQELSEANKENRKKYKNPHTAGKTSFAIIREEEQKERSDPLTNKDMFVITRKRKPGRVYKEPYEDTMSKINEMERIDTQEREDETQRVDSFAVVMGPEHYGRVRLYGRGVTKTSIKEKLMNCNPSSNTNETMEQIIEERVQQKVQERIDAQKDVIMQDVTRNVIQQLQLAHPELQLNANMLRFNEHINRPSFGSNNQGVEDEEMED